MAKIKKYYVGAQHIADAIKDNTNDDWPFDSINAAINHGKKLMNDENRDIVIIVQIVRIIRRRELPLFVEKV